MSLTYKYFDPSEEEKVYLTEEQAKQLEIFNRVCFKNGISHSIEQWSEGNLVYVEYPNRNSHEHEMIIQEHLTEFPNTRLRVTAPFEKDGKFQLRTRYYFDEKGKLMQYQKSTLNQELKTVLDVFFDATGSEISKFEYEYENGNCIKTIEYDGEGKVIEHIEYEYDDDGNELLMREYFEDGSFFETKSF